MAGGYGSAVVLAALFMSMLSTSAWANDSSEAVPPDDLPSMHMPAVRKSDAMMHAGMVLVGLGGFSAVGGALVLQHAGAEGAAEEAVPGGIAMLGGGLSAVAIGIPLWIVGAEKNGSPHAVVVDGTGLGWRLRF